MKLNFKYALFFLIFLAFFACKDKENKDDKDQVKENTLEVAVNLFYEGQPVDFQTVFLTEDGYRIRFSKVNFIFTELTNGEHTLLKSAVYKFEDDPHLVWKGKGDYNLFSRIEGFLGVVESENHKDPSARPLDDPLSIMNAGDMHWGWNPGYIFLAVEGRADTTTNQSGSLNQILTYHVGLNDFLRPIEFENVNWNKTSEHHHVFSFNVDLATLFNGEGKVDVKTERSTHTNPGEEELSGRFIANFIKGISVE